MFVWNFCLIALAPSLLIAAAILFRIAVAVAQGARPHATAAARWLRARAAVVAARLAAWARTEQPVLSRPSVVTLPSARRSSTAR